jgi:TPR repeat protein
MICRTILLLIPVLLFSTPLHADTAAANYELYRGNFKAAAKEFSRLAESGDVHAQSYLGYMYFVGQGVEQDYGEAVRWYRKAAEKGDRDAQYNLAVAYAFGKGVKKDLKQAAQWYLKAAEQGHAAAEYSLGISYANGEGVKQDTDTAMKWFSRAADQGYAGAQKALDILQKQDATAAAKDDTDNSADSKNKEDLLNMDGPEPLLPDAETPAKILPEHPPAAVAGADPASVPDNIAAQSREQAAPSPGTYEGTGQPANEVKQDVTPDFKSLDETAIDSTASSGAVSMDESNNAGEEGAGSVLHRLFDPQAAGPEEGAHAAGTNGGDNVNSAAHPSQATMSENTSRDEKQGLLSHLFGNTSSFTAEEGAGSDAGKNNKTGKTDIDPSIYKRGMAALAHKHYRDAATLFHDSATQGDPGSQFQLGALFYQGLGVGRDYHDAKYWYQRAADNGNADAQYCLGNMYLMGEGVEQNDQEAMYWYKKAADQGHESARQNLENLKEIMGKADEKPRLAEGEAPANGSASAKEKHKQGFLSRLFGKDKSKTGNKNPPGATTQQSDKVADVKGSKKTGEKPSFMSKEGGGLFGHLFGTDQNSDDQNKHKTVPAKEKQSDNATKEAAPSPDSGSGQPVADTKQREEDKPSIMSKEGGGLFGYLFGWGKQKDKSEVTEQDKASTTSHTGSKSAGTNDDSAAQ